MSEFTACWNMGLSRVGSPRKTRWKTKSWNGWAIRQWFGPLRYIPIGQSVHDDSWWKKHGTSASATSNGRLPNSINAPMNPQFFASGGIFHSKFNFFLQILSRKSHFDVLLLVADSCRDRIPRKPPSCSRILRIGATCIFHLVIQTMLWKWPGINPRTCVKINFGFRLLRSLHMILNASMWILVD